MGALFASGVVKGDALIVKISVVFFSTAFFAVLGAISGICLLKDWDLTKCRKMISLAIDGAVLGAILGLIMAIGAVDSGLVPIEGAIWFITLIASLGAMFAPAGVDGEEMTYPAFKFNEYATTLTENQKKHLDFHPHS